MCGVFGVRSRERDVARLTYFGLFALQHRGQESAGIAVSEGGDVLLRLAEGEREIKVSTVEANGNAEDSDEDSDDEPEEVREKVFKAGKTLAEAAVRDVKKGGKVEVQVNIGADLTITLVAREVGGKGGVRGTVSA